MDRILVIQLRELGDTLLSTPMIRQLKRLHPQASIDVLCEPRNDQILRHHPCVSEIHHWPRKARGLDLVRLVSRLARNRYDLVVDAQSLPKTAIVTRLTGAPQRIGFRRRWLRNGLCYTHPYGQYASGCGNFVQTDPAGGLVAEYAALTKLKMLQDTRADLSDLTLDFHLGDEDRDAAVDFRNHHFRPPVVALFVVNRFAGRRWSTDKFAQLGDRLARLGFQVFLVYGPGEESQARDVASRMKSRPLVDYPQITLPVLKGVLEHCTLFVGNDGGPKHVATAAGLPSIALFGPLHPENWTPPDQAFVATRSDSRLVPTQRACVEEGHLPDVPIETVWRSVEQFIYERGLRAA